MIPSNPNMVKKPMQLFPIVSVGHMIVVYFTAFLEGKITFLQLKLQ